MGPATEWRLQMAHKRGTALASPTGPAEEPPELAWARARADEIARFPGEYVALAAGEIVAHDPSYLLLTRELTRRGIGNVYIVSVPSGDGFAL